MSTSAERAAALADADRGQDGRLEAALIVMSEAQDRLRGQLFETIEAFGLAPRQEDAAKRLIRRCTYSGQAALEAAIRNALERN